MEGEQGGDWEAGWASQLGSDQAGGKGAALGGPREAESALMGVTAPSSP